MTYLGIALLAYAALMLELLEQASLIGDHEEL